MCVFPFLQLADLKFQERKLTTVVHSAPEKVVCVSVEMAAPGVADVVLKYMVTGSASWFPSYGTMHAWKPLTSFFGRRCCHLLVVALQISE